MKSRFLAPLFILLVSICGLAQIQSILIPAGTPEDEAIQAIGKEPDEAKRVPMWEEFVTKYASDKPAVAYGNAELARYFAAVGNPEKALAYGDKAIAAVPNNLDILTSQAMAAQQAKDNAKMVKYAVMAGKAINGIKKTPKPENMSDADWSATLDNQRQNVQQQYETFDNVAYAGIANEEDAKKRIALASEYTGGFPDGKYADNVHQLAITSLLQARDFAGVSKYGEAALAANPNNVSTLGLLAYALAEDPNAHSPYATRAMEHARKAIELGKAKPDSERSLRLSVGLAYSAIGYCLLKQEKLAASLPEFKSAGELLKDEPGSYEVVLFREGFAYAKLKKAAEARELLNEVIAMKGPYQNEARRVLTQMSAGGKQQ